MEIPIQVGNITQLTQGTNNTIDDAIKYGHQAARKETVIKIVYGVEELYADGEPSSWRCTLTFDPVPEGWEKLAAVGIGQTKTQALKCALGTFVDLVRAHGVPSEVRAM